MSAASPAEKTWTTLELLRWTTDYFSTQGIEGARLDAETLLAFALGCRRIDLYVNFEKPASPDERARFRALVKRRAGERVPVSHLVGSKEFWSLPLRVSSEVLTPRPDTETLVEAALDRLPERDGDYRVLDVGTGSGAVALAIAHERPGAAICATDISASALQISRTNAEQLLLSEKVRFLEGSLFEPVEGERFDLVVSNPPYLARRDATSLAPELGHEPEEALFGGEDGLAVLEPLVAGAPAVLAPGGWLAVEIDPGQVERVAAAFAEAGFRDVKSHCDLAKRPRVVTGRREGQQAAETGQGPGSIRQ